MKTERYFESSYVVVYAINDPFLLFLRTHLSFSTRNYFLTGSVVVHVVKMLSLFLFAQVLNHEISLSYPPSVAYQTAFLKHVISQVCVHVCVHYLLIE